MEKIDKAEELMIGDWVDFGSFKRQVIQSDYCQDVNGDCILDGTRPIPLTDEILEANGFEKNSAKYYRIVIDKQMAGDGYETQEVAISEKGLLLIFTSVCDVRIPIKYVNQLQHALRLCNIDKEIIVKQ